VIKLTIPCTKYSRDHVVVSGFCHNHAVQYGYSNQHLTEVETRLRACPPGITPELKVCGFVYESAD
jgi:hypothetical protein